MMREYAIVDPGDNEHCFGAENDEAAMDYAEEFARRYLILECTLVRLEDDSDGEWVTVVGVWIFK